MRQIERKRLTEKKENRKKEIQENKKGEKKERNIRTLQEIYKEKERKTSRQRQTGGNKKL